MRVVTPGLTWRRVRAVSLDASGSLLIVCIRQVPSRKERESEVGGYDLRACLPEAGDLEPADCLQQVYAPEPEGTPPSDRYVHGKGVGYGGIIIRVARSHSMRHRTDRCHRSGFSPLGTFDMNYCFMRSSRPPLLAFLLLASAMPAHAQLTESEPNNDFATANFLPADTVLSGVTCAAPETDYLYIVPPSDGVMRIITSISANTPSPIPNDLLIQVISDEIHHYGDGIPLVGANGVPITDTSTWTCIAADTVFFVVHNSTMFNGYCYTYEVRYEMTAPHFSADVEPNNSLAEAVELPHATDVEGHLGFITDPAYGGSDIYDYYRIVPLEDGVLRVIVESENTGVLVNPVNMHLEEFNAQTFEVGLNSVPLADTLYWTCLRADTFHLRFAMPTFTDCGISYRLRYDILPGLFTTEQEPNNSIAEAVVLPLGTDQEGHLGFLLGPLNTDWYDYYNIVLPDNGDLRVIIGSENAGTVSNTVNLSLEGVYEQPIDMGVNGALFTDTLYWNCLTPGSYHLKFAMPTATDCGITYRMRCDLLAPVYANDPEPNGVIPQAVPATMGVPVDGHLQHG